MAARNQWTGRQPSREPNMTTYDKPEQASRSLLDASLEEVQLASVTQGRALGGGSVLTETADEAVPRHELAQWYPGLNLEVDAPAAESDLFAAGLTPQVGPLNTGYITFNGGVPVGGFSQLTLFQSGNFNFNGHFHVSGAPSYNVGFAVGVRSSRGVLYTFLKSGHLAGTFEPGSRDFDWSVQEFRAVIREDWPNLALNSTWWWSAHVNWDPLAIVNSVKTLASTVGAVASVIALV
jgi:hypothetical protein